MVDTDPSFAVPDPKSADSDMTNVVAKADPYLSSCNAPQSKKHLPPQIVGTDYEVILAKRWLGPLEKPTTDRRHGPRRHPDSPTSTAIPTLINEKSPSPRAPNCQEGSLDALTTSPVISTSKIIEQPGCSPPNMQRGPSYDVGRPLATSFQCENNSQASISRLRQGSKNFSVAIPQFSIHDISISNDNDDIFAPYSRTSFGCLTSEPLSKSATRCQAPKGILSALTWKEARAIGVGEGRWILIDIQDPDTIKRHALNRDIWNDTEILGVLREKFIYLQWQSRESGASEYNDNYFHDAELQSTYPHIAIVDPETGNQLKLWSGYVPKPRDFLSDLHAFLNSSVQDQFRFKANPSFQELIPMKAAEEDDLDYQLCKPLKIYQPTIKATPIRSDILGVLFKSCADFFWLVTKELCLLDSIGQKEKSVVRATFEKFYVWGAGFQAEQGELDRILVKSTGLKDQIISLLLEIAKILDTVVCQEIDSAEVNDERFFLLSLAGSVGKYPVENENSDNDSIFSSDTDSEDSIDTLLDDLQAYVECLNKLRLPLELPAPDSAKWTRDPPSSLDQPRPLSSSQS